MERKHHHCLNSNPSILSASIPLFRRYHKHLLAHRVLYLTNLSEKTIHTYVAKFLHSVYQPSQTKVLHTECLV